MFGLVFLFIFFIFISRLSVDVSIFFYIPNTEIILVLV